MGSNVQSFLDKSKNNLKKSAKVGFLSRHKVIRKSGKAILTQFSSVTDGMYQRSQMRSTETLVNIFKRFGVKKYAVLVDCTTKDIKVPDIKPASCLGYYSYDLRCIGKKFNKQTVKPISYESGVPDCDGWLVASFNHVAAYTLNEILYDNNKGDQIVTRISISEATPYYSYSDFFSGNTATVIQVHNYFDRLYENPFPIDFRFCLKTFEGRQIDSGQFLIPAGGTYVIDSRTMNLGDFCGYIEIEFEAEGITSKVRPFLQYYIDYLGDKSIACNHQSGFGTFGTDCCFIRGFLPDNEPGHRLVAAMFNHNQREPLQPKAILEYFQNGEQHRNERDMKKVERGHMVMQDINELFSDVLSKNVSAVRLFIKSDLSMHRPNLYHTTKSIPENTWLNTYHQTGTSYRGEKSGNPYRPDSAEGHVYKEDELEKLDLYGIYPWQLHYPIFPEYEKIDSILGYHGESEFPIKEFTFQYFDNKGIKIYENDKIYDYQTDPILNLNNYLKDNNVQISSGGIFCAIPQGRQNVPYSLALDGGFSHRLNPYLTTTSAGAGGLPNIPFCFEETLPRSTEFKSTPHQSVKLFSRGVFLDGPDGFDTMFSIIYLSSGKNYDRSCYFEIDVVTADGKNYTTRRTISPYCASNFWLGDIINETKAPTDSPYYAVWVRTTNRLLTGLTLLKRKKDNAISLEHMYYGKF